MSVLFQDPNRIQKEGTYVGLRMIRMLFVMRDRLFDEPIFRKRRHRKTGIRCTYRLKTV